MSSRFHCSLTPLCEQFLTSGLYLRNWSPRTARTYAQGLSTLAYETPTKQQLDTWVIALRDRGVTPGGVNMYARTINSYLSWLHAEGHVPSRLKVKLLRTTKHQPVLLTPDDIKRLMRFVPQSDCERRTLTLVQVLLDTGIRIEEALTLKLEKVDLDGLSIVVMGKGAKERTVPFSRECRKALFRWTAKQEGKGCVFATRSGGRLAYRNTYRDISRLCKRIAALRWGSGVPAIVIRAICLPSLMRSLGSLGNPTT